MTDAEHFFPQYRAGYIGTLKHEDDLERAAEERDGQIDTLADQLYNEYISDWHKVAEILAEDTNILADIAQAFVKPSVIEGNVYKVIHGYLKLMAREDAEDQMEDR